MDKFLDWEDNKKKLKKALTPKEFQRAVEAHKTQETMNAGIFVWDEMTGRTKKYKYEPKFESNRHYKTNRDRITSGRAAPGAGYDG